MTREEGIKILKFQRGYFCDLKGCEEHQAFTMAIKALEQEPCDDAISRQAAIDAFERFIHELGIEDEPYNYGEMALSIKNVPPVNPQEPKTGRWEWVKYDYPSVLGNWVCSACKSVVVECVGKDMKRKIPTYKYCPNCGAKIQEVKA